MANVNLHIPSFNSGELAETMASRFGVEKVATGCRVLRNMLPHVHGPVEKRPGMQFLGYATHTTDAPRLLEFNFSATTRFCIEFAASEFKIWSPDTGALVTTLATISHPYTYAECWEVQARQVNDVVYLVHPNHAPRKLTRVADNDWTCTEIDYKYPPLLDENVEDDRLVNPIIETLWESQLAMAEEFEVPVLNEVPIPWVEMSRSGATDTAWFELESGTAATVKISVEVLKLDGSAWVEVSNTNIGSGWRAEFCFQPAGVVTNLRTRYRLYSGGAWGAWADFGSTLTSFLPAASTAANMPNMTARVRMTFYGTGGVVTTSDKINFKEKTSYCVGPIMDLTAVSGYRPVQLGYWFDGTVSPMTKIIYVPPSEPPTLPNKTVALQIWNGTAWATIESFNYNASYNNFILVSNENGTLKVREYGTTHYSVASAEEGPWKMRFLSTYENFGGCAANVEFLNDFSDIIHGTITESDFDYELGRSPSATTDPYTGGVTMPANAAWQVVVRIDNFEDIPAGAKVTVQRKTATNTWGTITSKTLASGEEGIDIIIPGKTFTVDTVVRAIYSSTSGEFTEGEMWIETVEYPTSPAIEVKLSATSGEARIMTASASLFQADHVGAFWQVAHRRDLSYTEIVGVVGTFPATKLTSKPIRVVGRWDFYSYGTWRGKVFLERLTAGDSWEVIRTWSSNKDRNVIATGEVEVDATLRIRVSGMVGEAASGADVPRFLLEVADSLVYGLVKVTAYTSATQITVDVIRPAHSTAYTKLWSEGAWSDVRGYPAAVGIHEGRLWFGGSDYQPAALWASVSNDYENFRRSSNDDGSFVVALAAETGSQIKWLSSADDAMLIGTGGEEWTIRSNVEGQPITPTNVKAGRRGAYSSAHLQAKVTQDATVFVQRNRQKLRQASYSATEGAFQASDMTVLAPHITLAGIKQIAIQQAPYGIIWAVLDDGEIAALTFEREQNVFAWSPHETDGTVKSIAVLSGVDSDEVWLSVERNGRATIERLDPWAMERRIDDWQRLLYVDAGKRLTGPASSFSGLTHLASRAVIGMADGVAFSKTVSAGGVLTLDASATNVTVGLPYDAKLQPMPIEVPRQDGTSQARKFKVSRIGCRVLDSKSGKVADDFDATFENLPYSGAGLFTGMTETAIQAATKDQVDACVKDTSPYPLMVASMVIKLDVYGE